MEVEKQQGGGAKGGFFNLFDWKVGKSRKKLFPAKPELPESSNQGKENFHGSLIARRQQVLENGFLPNSGLHNDYASSASGDSEYGGGGGGTKAPGVVARLMGLDSLPTSNPTSEPCFSPFLDSQSFRDSRYAVAAAPALQSGQHDIVVFECARNKLDGLSRNPLDLRLQNKKQNRPIERFQREVLPPKSANKPISVAHNRLLSPIKSPGFIPPKNAAYVIEAAAKRIDQSPRATAKGKLPPLGSSSVPFRIRDLKEKMEAAAQRSSQKGNEHDSSKYMKKQPNTRGTQSRSEDNYLYKGSEESKRIVGSQRLKSSEKSVSLAAQAKSNISQKKNRPPVSVGNRSSGKPKEHNRNPQSTQKNFEKQGSSRRQSEVLRLNHQKQNCASAEDGDKFEASCSYTKDRKEPNLSTNYVNGRTNRTAVNKVVIDSTVTSSRKTNFVAADTGKEFSSSRPKTSSKRKLLRNGNIQSGGNVAPKGVAMKEEKSVKCNISFECDSEWDESDKKNSLDVVSFTFSSPIKKSGTGSNTISELSSSSFSNCDPPVRESDSRSSATHSSGFNLIGGDALSILLEQKLRELSTRVELSQKDISESASVSNTNNSYETVNLVKSPPMDDDICSRRQEMQNASDYPSVDKHWVKAEKENKGRQFMEKDGDSSNSEYQRYYLQGSVSVSSQPSFSGASCDSFDVDRSPSNEGAFPCLSFESYDDTNWSSTRISHPAEGDVDISDTASCLSVGTISENVTSTLYNTDSKDSSYWELHYILDILNGAELMSEEFALGQAYGIIAPDLFDQLENQKVDSKEQFATERRVLFDCVSECLEMRCGTLLSGSCKFWAKKKMMLHRRQWLAEELYRDVSGWINVEELMVDELVDKDMSSKNGKWVDFEVEAFEEGVEIEKRILNSLVDELIDDFLF